MASRLGVRIQDIDSALNNAFAQRQISTIYTQRNQYRIVLEVDPRYQRDPTDLSLVSRARQGRRAGAARQPGAAGEDAGAAGRQPPGAVPGGDDQLQPAPRCDFDEATQAIQQAVAELRMPDSIHVEAAGDAKAFAAQASTQPLLIIAALISVYIVLGVLYESLAHPLTIISTLPSAGPRRADRAEVRAMELSVIALIGIILLIGIVKKNGIMLVDFALEQERGRGLSAERAVLEAARERFRPILMTTFAALLGAMPLAIASGPGSELRRPLGIAIIGGLLVSQVLTLYTTPMIYLLLDQLRRRLEPQASRRPSPRTRAERRRRVASKPPIPCSASGAAAAAQAPLHTLAPR